MGVATPSGLQGDLPGDIILDCRALTSDSPLGATTSTSMRTSCTSALYSNTTRRSAASRARSICLTLSSSYTCSASRVLSARFFCSSSASAVWRSCLAASTAPCACTRSAPAVTSSSLSRSTSAMRPRASTSASLHAGAFSWSCCSRPAICSCKNSATHSTAYSSNSLRLPGRIARAFGAAATRAVSALRVFSMSTTAARAASRMSSSSQPPSRSMRSGPSAMLEIVDFCASAFLKSSSTWSRMASASRRSCLVRAMPALCFASSADFPFASTSAACSTCMAASTAALAASISSLAAATAGSKDAILSATSRFKSTMVECASFTNSSCNS
mmetsp:Transcript_100572/g.310179  ORF Transcript_100572/g.310179 Transcript_100572/m.310179 type:complete len:330 (-) Transcript_100572:188-1177(-)